MSQKSVVQRIESNLGWLLQSDEPWTRYRALVDLQQRPAQDPEVQAARDEMLAHPQLQALIETAVSWPGYPLKRHNDAKHPLHAFTTLADFGLDRRDPGLDEAISSITAHQSDEGAFQTQIHIYKSFGGSNEPRWTWMNCDAPLLLYALLAFGLAADQQVQAAQRHVLSLANENGWRCAVSPELGKFRGPGRKLDPCPISNVYALRALAQVPELANDPATSQGIEMLLRHWERQSERKLYLFGIGTDFRKLKYPFVWYDVLHVVDVLSRFPQVHADPRFRAMVEIITEQADENGRFTATSMYRAWKGWSFADKKRPSAWLTFLVLRILQRIGAVELKNEELA